MAMAVIISSQPSTHARIYGAYRAIQERLRAFKRVLARAAALRRNLPHGLTMCCILFVITALITRGDAAAFNDQIAHLRGKAETQAIYASAMQALPTMAAMGAKAMWLGDTGAGMHCITDTSLAVKGSLRTNTTVI
eukprot:5459653-Pleurochrysis_carterae.AAC.1